MNLQAPWLLSPSMDLFHDYNLLRIHILLVLPRHRLVVFLHQSRLWVETSSHWRRNALQVLLTSLRCMASLLSPELQLSGSTLIQGLRLIVEPHLYPPCTVRRKDTRLKAPWQLIPRFSITQLSPQIEIMEISQHCVLDSTTLSQRVHSVAG